VVYLTRTSTTVESTKLVGDSSTKLYKPHQYRSDACDPKVIGPLLAPAPWYQPVAPHGRRLPGSGGLVRRFPKPAGNAPQGSRRWRRWSVAGASKFGSS
jgi:hypothetical protein